MGKDKNPMVFMDEFGGTSQVRFPSPNSARMYDTEGNIVLCKCGKPAGSGAYGREAYIAWCEDCCPLYKPREK